MNLKITSEKIDNPLLVELLRKLTDSFNRMGCEFSNKTYLITINIVNLKFRPMLIIVKAHKILKIYCL